MKNMAGFEPAVGPLLPTTRPMLEGMMSLRAEPGDWPPRADGSNHHHVQIAHFALPPVSSRAMKDLYRHSSSLKSILRTMT